MLVRIRRRWLAALAAGALAAMLAAGCSDDKGTNVNHEPPEIPPASTFVIDFSDFGSPTRACSPIDRERAEPASLSGQLDLGCGERSGVEHHNHGRVGGPGGSFHRGPQSRAHPGGRRHLGVGL